MGDPGARLLTSPLPQPTLPTSCFSCFSLNPSPPPSYKKKKKSDHARPRQLLGSEPCPPPPARLPRARAASLLPPAPILSPDDSHRCAGGLTAEATRPPPPSASRRETAPLHPPTLREAGPPRSKASGDHSGSGKAAALPPLGEVGPPGGAEKARRVKPPETHKSPRASSSLHFAL